MISVIHSIELCGISGVMVRVETDVATGFPGFDIVGLPDAAVREARERVRSAARSSEIEFPVRRITVNLAPADLKKEGSTYDLPILLGILQSADIARFSTEGRCFVGELSLDGAVRPCCGALPLTLTARDAGFREIYLPAPNAAEASVAEGIDVYPVHNFAELLAHLTGGEKLSPIHADTASLLHDAAVSDDFSDVKGQDRAKRALEIAAAGGHNILLIGPPGTGKSMLARRLPGILPDLTLDEAIEITKIYSVSGLMPEGKTLLTLRPFRSPHHTMSSASLAGGGRVPKPGEVSLAHNGVLFLDELPEFSKDALEVLRQPLEDGELTITRVSSKMTYPASFMLVCAMNPCKCGYYGHPQHRCTCTKLQVQQYLSRISGPLLDRIDIHVEVPPLRFEELAEAPKGESSAVIRARVNAARTRQLERFAALGGANGATCNAHIPPSLMDEVCALGDESRRLLQGAFERMGLSARAYTRILRVARTIADLAASDRIEPEHVAEAVQLRSLDRKYWTR